MGAAEHVHTTLSMPHLIRMIVINTLVLVELCIALYYAAQHPDEITPVFFKVLFAMLIPTLILGAYSKRWIRPKEKQ
jgi:ammonia channel protein AmtB